MRAQLLEVENKFLSKKNEKTITASTATDANRLEYY